MPTRRDFEPRPELADGRPAKKQRLFSIDSELPWRGSVMGEALGGSVTVLAYGTDEIGAGPRLHVHPYDETFIIIAGHGRFYVGEEVIEASAGEIVFGPASVPHRFENIGPGRLQTIDVHHSATWIQTDLT